MKIVFFILLIIATCSLILVNVSKKSITADKDKILELILVDNFAEDGIQLNSFKKINSIDKGDLYYIEYEANLYFQHDGRYMNISKNKWFGEKISKGESRKITSSAVFRKTNTGWFQMGKEPF